MDDLYGENIDFEGFAGQKHDEVASQKFSDPFNCNAKSSGCDSNPPSTLTASHTFQ